jgi:hypothetical protein
MKLQEFRAVKDDVSIERPEDLVDREVSVHWHFQEKRYSVSLRASNGKWYVVRHRETGAQAFFGKLVLRNAHFKVAPAGARKAYETKKRNVHASVIGTVRLAQFMPEKAFVPCGHNVFYSHILYPEPEFKLVGHELPGQGVETNPGIEYAEMLAVGCDNGRPNMLTAGIIRLTRMI